MSNEDRKSFLVDLYADFSDIMIINEYNQLIKYQERGYDYKLPIEVLDDIITKRNIKK